MAWAEGSLADLSRLELELLGALELGEVACERAQPRERRGRPWIIPPVERLVELEGGLVVLSRGLERTEGVVDLGEGSRERRTQRGLARELAIETIGTEVDELTRGHLLAPRPVGIRELEEVDEKPADLLGPPPLGPRAVALRGERARLVGHGRGVADQQREDRRTGRDTHTVARDEARDAIADGGRPGADQQPGGVPAQIVRQLSGGSVPPFRIGVDRLEQDVVEVALKASAQSARGARASVAESLLGVGITPPERGAGAHRLGRAHRSLDRLRTTVREKVRASGDE